MSLFKRLLGNKSKSEIKSKQAEHSKYFPEEKLPIDEKFTYNFNKNGGKFLYCEDWEEVNEAFDNILIENDWYEKNVFCIDEQLKQKFDGYNLNFGSKENASFFLSKCESLVANNGSILLSSNQIKEKNFRNSLLTSSFLRPPVNWSKISARAFASLKAEVKSTSQATLPPSKILNVTRKKIL